jgi:hypothetical protein
MNDRIEEKMNDNKISGIKVYLREVKLKAKKEVL